jgi:predicted transposase YdaD
MLRSEFLDEIRDKARDEGRLLGRDEGRLLGRDEGRLLGRDEGLAESVLQVLQDRFQRVTVKLRQAIEAIKDSAQLRRLLTQAITAESLADFRQKAGLR